MSGISDYSQNKLIDLLLRGQAFTAPATLYHTLLTCTKGARGNSTVYALNDTIALTANDGKIHLYKCTTAGTSAASQSTLYPGAVGEAITDGTAVFTEQSAALDAGTAAVEVSGGSFARVAVTASLANYAGTQSAGSTTASSGTGGTTSNNGTITFPTPTGQWVPSGGAIWGFAIMDASSGGNQLLWGPLTALKSSITTGDPAPSFAAAALSAQIGS